MSKPIRSTFDPATPVSELNIRGEGTMVSHLGIAFTAVHADALEARMPVDERTVRPGGILHGGASAAFAETIGSTASALLIDREKQFTVGLEVNANHLRPVRAGSFVTGRATAIHIGRSTHVWDIRISDSDGKPVCVSRLTVVVLDRPA